MTDYTDIIHFPYHGVQHHVPMDRKDRASIMAAFDALTGLDAELSKAATRNINNVENELQTEPLLLVMEQQAYADKM